MPYEDDFTAIVFHHVVFVQAVAVLAHRSGMDTTTIRETLPLNDDVLFIDVYPGSPSRGAGIIPSKWVERLLRIARRHTPPPLQDATQQSLTGSMASGLPFYADKG